MLGVNVDLLPLLISTIVAVLVGIFWYSNVMFGAEWRALVSSDESPKRSAARMFLVAIPTVLAFLVMSYVLGHVISFVKANTLFEGVQVGFLMWLGFVSTSMLINTIYQARQLKLFFIDSFYLLIVLILSGGILVSI